MSKLKGLTCGRNFNNRNALYKSKNDELAKTSQNLLITLFKVLTFISL